MSRSDYEHNFTNHTGSVARSGSYWINSERLSRTFCRPLSSGMADLLDVVMSVYAADRMSPRDFKGTATGQRNIRVQVGVRNPRFWNSVEMTEHLQNLLYWLSEDEWSFQFIKRESDPSLAESKRFLFPLPPDQPVTVSLFSGGLDSIAGFANHSRPAAGGSYALVSGYTQDRLAFQQRLQVRRIRSAWRERLTSTSAEIYHVAVPFGISKPDGCREEQGQRTRALVFLVIGILTALLADTDTLQVYENGIGALNLPLNETQLGVDNYRGVHPRSLIMAEKVFELALGQNVHIENPCLFQTKAEMCATLSVAGLAGAIRDTVSCDGFPQRAAQAQCGCCTSCILRRQSLHAAGLGEYDPASRYRHDLLSDRATLKYSQIYGLEASKYQVHKFANCLASVSPWKSLAASFPTLAITLAALVATRGFGADETAANFIRLFRTYVREWESLPGNLKPSTR